MNRDAEKGDTAAVSAENGVAGSDGAEAGRDIFPGVVLTAESVNVQSVPERASMATVFSFSCGFFGPVRVTGTARGRTRLSDWFVARRSRDWHDSNIHSRLDTAFQRQNPTTSRFIFGRFGQNTEH